MEQIIALITDFGLKGQHYVAQMKGVILEINPNAKIVDLTHNITPYSILEASYILNTSYEYFPENTIFVVVVDPGVGSSREILAIKTVLNYYIICPNNGIFSELQIIEECFVVENEEFFDKPVSNTFHGRDIMAPVAAHISIGTLLNEVGPPIDLADIRKLDLIHEVDLHKHILRATVQSIDSFGNIITNIALMETSFGDLFNLLKEHNQIRVEFQDHLFEGLFAPNYDTVPKGSLILIKGSSGFLELSINQGNASNELGIQVGDIITINF